MTYNTDARRSMTKPQRAAFLQAHDCTCYWCRLPIADDAWDVEHLIAKELMPPGSDWDAPENKAPIHRIGCHKAKTARDRRLIAKSNRIRRNFGPVEQRRQPRKRIVTRSFQKGQSRPIPTRAFPKRGKP